MSGETKRRKTNGVSPARRGRATFRKIGNVRCGDELSRTIFPGPNRRRSDALANEPAVIRSRNSEQRALLLHVLRNVYTRPLILTKSIRARAQRARAGVWKCTGASRFALRRWTSRENSFADVRALAARAKVGVAHRRCKRMHF